MHKIDFGISCVIINEWSHFFFQIFCSCPAAQKTAGPEGPIRSRCSVAIGGTWSFLLKRSIVNFGPVSKTKKKSTTTPSVLSKPSAGRRTRTRKQRPIIRGTAAKSRGMQTTPYRTNLTCLSPQPHRFRMDEKINKKRMQTRGPLTPPEKLQMWPGSAQLHLTSTAICAISLFHPASSW